MTNIVHNYRNHDLPRSNIFIVGLILKEERQLVANNQLHYVDIEIEPERETGHLMVLGTDGSITIPRLNDDEVVSMARLLSWVRLGRESHRSPKEQPGRLIRDVVFQVPLSITLG